MRGVVRTNDSDVKNPVTGKRVEPVLKPHERVKTRQQNITHEEMLLKQSGLVVLFTLNTGTGTLLTRKFRVGLTRGEVSYLPPPCHFSNPLKNICRFTLRVLLRNT